MLNKKLTIFVILLASCFFIQVSMAADPPVPKAVIDYMTSRAKRYHHYLFHNIRDNWNRLSENSKKRITDLGWAPPRPSRSFDANGVASMILDNDSGEDFLYMHRSMISRCNKIVAETNAAYGKVKGWTTIPAPGDKDYPVPPAYTVPGNEGLTATIARRKTDSYYRANIKPLEDTFKDPAQLRNMSLGELGARIESTIHSILHIRWSSESSYGYRPSGSGTIPNFDKKWDDPRYDWLGDTYASQLHPLFWKLHGWIDDRIEDWRRANKLSSIKWKGTWLGGPMSALSSVMKMSGGIGMDMDMGDEMDDTMPTVMGIIMGEVPEISFSDEIAMDDFIPKEYKPKTCKITKKKIL